MIILSDIEFLITLLDCHDNQFVFLFFFFLERLSVSEFVINAPPTAKVI